MRTFFCLIAVAILVQAGSSSAQGRYRGYGGYGGYGGGYHASTAAEGFQRGMADVIRSTGAYNLMTSQAMSNVEDARQKYISNRLYGTQTYFEMRKLNKQARAAEAGPRPTQQDVIRYAQERAPNRLTASEVDPLTGSIAWPSLLQEDAFKTEREELEKLYGERAGRGSLTASEVMKANQLIQQMDATLQANVSKVPSLLYSPAKSFLKSLSYEAYLRPQ
jgi:hypothetical protein